LPEAVRTLSFGSADQAMVRLLSSELTLTGTRARVSIEDGDALEFTLPLLGHAAAFDATAALAVVLALRGRAAVPNALQGLRQVAQTAGRMVPRAIPGDAWVIDDSYNANPESVAGSLRALVDLARGTGGKSVAVLGDMKELGANSAREHARMGELAVRLGIDVLVGCGPESVHTTATAARMAAGRLALHPTRVVHVLDPLASAPIVRSLLRAGDVVLIKGSRSMAMERVVAALGAEGNERP
jgi:UDP-N-acetylmuramoyl-tripeptide--D-alanyl-D-alanine ligase